MTRKIRMCYAWCCITTMITLFSKRLVYFLTTSSDSFDQYTELALSGKIFSGVRTRQFPPHLRKYNREQRTKHKRHDWIPKRSCHNWSVTTTIFDVSDAVRVQSRLPESWCMVIVADVKSPTKHGYGLLDNPNIIYMDVQLQKKLFQEGLSFVEELPWNSFGRKNVGYLYAIASGAKTIWDFDDDNTIISDPPQIFDPLTEKVQVVLPVQEINQCKSFNPMPFMGASDEQSWARGVPLEDIMKPSCAKDKYDLRHEYIDVKKIGIYQSMANHDPDVDALFRLTHSLPINFKSKDMLLMVPSTAYAPFNAQATLFKYNSMFAMYLPVSVTGRVTDIWRSYCAQQLLKYVDQNIVFTSPQVTQYRNSHNYLADFESEMDLYLRSGTLISMLDNWTSTCTSVPCLYEDLIISMYERNYLEIDDVFLVQSWIDVLTNIGYKFPPFSRQNL